MAMKARAAAAVRPPSGFSTKNSVNTLFTALRHRDVMELIAALIPFLFLVWRPEENWRTEEEVWP